MLRKVVHQVDISLHDYIEMHSQQNIKFNLLVISLCMQFLFASVTCACLYFVTLFKIFGFHFTAIPFEWYVNIVYYS